MVSAKTKTAFLAYLPDVATLALVAIFSLSMERITPVEYPIPLHDVSISFPFKDGEIIPSYYLPFCNMGIPALIILAWIGINRFKNRRLLIAFLGLFFSVCLAFLITNLMKGPVGRLRPDFLDRCKPNEAIVGTIVCTGEPSVIREGRRSFPSGHASSTFGGMVFAALFLAGQIRLLDGYAYLHKFFICIAPIFAALLVGLSRIVDHKHHWSDVLAGAIIGIVSAVTAYFYYFPSLASEACSTPRSARLDGLEQAPLNQPDNTV